jgi:hypothetical protein
MSNCDENNLQRFHQVYTAGQSKKESRKKQKVFSEWGKHKSPQKIPSGNLT